MIILGIDPGFERMGCAVLEKSHGGEKLLYSTCLVSSRSDAHEKRLLVLAKGLKKIIKKFKPDTMAIEKLFFTANQKTALKVAEARGVALLLAAENDLKVFEFTPLEVKMAMTGYGRAEKDQVRKMVLAMLKISGGKKLDDEIDAIAIALTCPLRLIEASLTKES
ncbi:MAG: crossover junction endodeoxyribonuclease RuvC [Candidatus Terrybacteria bacterium RIFCSPLOWO2_02_42_20]|uniref:Crossover junction endodeoxyribonuclease RuvC n=2 Tax=Candidatus Terryibacteriota TaxID=1817920 RepID=A0A1G2PZZ0_9BACT|nr:MAG: crossover junction endodeoxyribonuclease RuvC [Candidatus Terrybacteria bacterium RIFCSPLOWO2_02_42_20]